MTGRRAAKKLLVESREEAERSALERVFQKYQDYASIGDILSRKLPSSPYIQFIVAKQEHESDGGQWGWASEQTSAGMDEMYKAHLAAEWLHQKLAALPDDNQRAILTKLTMMIADLFFEVGRANPIETKGLVSFAHSRTSGNGGSQSAKARKDKAEKLADTAKQLAINLRASDPYVFSKTLSQKIAKRMNGKYKPGTLKQLIKRWEEEGHLPERKKRIEAVR